MKPLQFLLPAATLVLGSYWITHQVGTLAEVERGNLELKTKIRSGSVSRFDQPTETEEPVIRIGNDSHPPDWKTILARFSQIKTGTPYNPNIINQQLGAMDSDELLAALDEIERLEASRREKDWLVAMVVGPLMKKNTEAGLDRFIDRLEDAGSGFLDDLNRAFGQWVEDNPAGARAWFDRQIMAGNFDSRTIDGRSRSRVEFESILMKSMLAANVSDARDRLAGMHQDQRVEVMQAFQVPELNDQEIKNYASLVREQLMEEDSNRVIARTTARALIQSDLAGVSLQLDRIGATPAERVEAVKQVWSNIEMGFGPYRRLSLERIDAARTWMTSQAPDADVERMIGGTLAKAARQGSLSFPEALAQAIVYYENSGKEDGLAGFLESDVAAEHRAEAIPLLDKVSDTEVRTRLVKKLESGDR
ncbi:hypothetical protein JIN84_01805 [Luteolibacter yonseiensis]|uniref:Uncharacterized protein n=1 Tax=Luteolibacter yonseiensis TaxID=1144680 RepID=A0A934V8P4_9BACT|nr:hypothetical protein [Luteolibacter yonseiensis]MBK1814328.1 hypothetical protein [Luteolibacter yonseiensis]